jgi:hypothetical protein
VRGQALEDAGLPLATPGDQVRGVEALAAQQGSEGAGVGGGGIGLRQDAPFVLGGEGPAPGVGDNLRVGPGRGGQLGGDGFACLCTPIGRARATPILLEHSIARPTISVDTVLRLVRYPLAEPILLLGGSGGSETAGHPAAHHGLLPLGQHRVLRLPVRRPAPDRRLPAAAQSPQTRVSTAAPGGGDGAVVEIPSCKSSSSRASPRCSHSVRKVGIGSPWTGPITYGRFWKQQIKEPPSRLYPCRAPWHPPNLDARGVIRYPGLDFDGNAPCSTAGFHSHPRI